MRARRLFVAGSTGATGRVLEPLARKLGLDVVPHLRPTSAAAGTADPRACVLDLADTTALTRVLEGCTTVVQLIGTMRKRFAQGDTYETSDIGTTRQLIAAAKPAGIDHLVLLSSVGAGSPRGSYLQAKARAEALVRESGIEWTVFRPSFLEGPDRTPPPLSGALTRLLGLKRYEPILLTDLSAAMLHVCRTRSHLGEALEGAALFELVAEAKR